MTDRFWEAAYPEHLRGHEVDPATLPGNTFEIATRCARRFGSGTAFSIVLPTGHSADLTFEQVDRLSDQFAAYLVHEAGLGVGDVLAVQLPNSLHYPVAVLGAWKAGVVVTNVNPLYTERELRLQLEDCGAKVLLACDLFLAAARPVASGLGMRLLTASLWDFFDTKVAHGIQQSLASRLPPMPEPAPLRFSEALALGVAHDAPRRHHPTALYQYTGGTTGRSKGAVITHRNILAAISMTRLLLDAHGGPRGNESVLTVLPMYHVFAFTLNFLLFFDVGARNLLIPNPRPLANLRPAFDNFRVDWMSGVDTLYAGLLAEPWFTARPPAMRFAISGGAALRPTTASAWQALVCPVLEGYGMTETTCMVSCQTPTATPMAGSVGRPIPGCDVRIVSDTGCPVPTGDCGELVVRGPQVIETYLNMPDETAAAIVDGWLHTGDIALFEPDGNIRIVDRKKDMILVSGFNVYPNEVEAVMATHPDVLEAAVIGVPDAATGEAVCAFVTPRRPDLQAEELILHCRSQLTAYKVPRQIRFRDQLPKSPVGKVLRAKLRETL